MHAPIENKERPGKCLAGLDDDTVEWPPYVPVAEPRGASSQVKLLPSLVTIGWLVPAAYRRRFLLLRKRGEDLEGAAV